MFEKEGWEKKNGGAIDFREKSTKQIKLKITTIPSFAVS